MASITVFSCVAVAAGLLLAFKVGRAIHVAGVGEAIGALFLYIFLGAGLALAAGFSHATCSELLKLCAQTTDTTIWAVSYPLLAVPLYWLVTLTASTAGTNDGGGGN